MIQTNLVLLVDAIATSGQVRGSSIWQPGPFPHEYQDHEGRTVITDAKTRATNFPRPVAPFIMGSQLLPAEQPTGERFRFHAYLDQVGCFDVLAPMLQVVNEDSLEIRCTHAELLIAEGEEHAPAVLALYLEARSESLDDVLLAAYRLARRRGGLETGLVRGAYAHALARSVPGLCDGIEFPGKEADGVEGSVYTLLLADGGITSAAPGITEPDLDQGASCDDLELYAMARCEPVATLHASPERISEDVAGATKLSRSWRLLTKRHGAAFQMRMTVEDPFRSLARIYFATLYADAFMLGRLQDQLVRGWESRSVRALSTFDSTASGQGDTAYGLSPLFAEMSELDREVEVDSAKYAIKRSVANTGRAIDILGEAQRVLGVQQRLGEVQEQIRVLARLADQDEQRHAAGLAVAQQAAQERLAQTIGVLGSIGIPLTLCIDIYQMLGLPITGPWLVGAAVVAAGLGAGTWLLLRAKLRKH